MRITFHVEGGFAHFPGRARPRTIDLDQPGSLPVATAERLRSLATRALAAPVPPPARGADMRTIVITIESGGDTRRVALSEPPGEPKGEPANEPAWAGLCEVLQSLE